MRVGTIIGLPDSYTQFARIKDQYGVGYTVEPGELPESVELGDELAYKVEIWANDSGLGYALEEE
jgi:hypothetical protein